MDGETLRKIVDYIFKDRPDELSELELKRIERHVLNNPEFFEESITKCIKENCNIINLNHKHKDEDAEN